MLRSFLELLDGHVPDETVWTADISYWISANALESHRHWETERGYLALCRELCIFPYYWYDRFWLAEPEYDSNVRVKTVEVEGKTTRTWETPVGEMSEEQVYLPESFSTAHLRYAVADRNDLEVLSCLVEHRRLRPAVLDDYSERVEVWREYGGLPSIALPRSPLSAFFYEWAGVQSGVFLLEDYPSEVRCLFGLMAEQEEPILDAVCTAAPPLVHFADNLSSDNMSGYYETLMAPVHRHRIERLHAAGTRCAVHLDGVVEGLLPRLAEAGFDAVEALTPQPGGDLPVERLRSVARSDRLILWGGVPGVLFAPPYTWEDVKHHVEKVLNEWEGTPFVLGVADQVPPDGDIGYCRKIADLVRQRKA